MSVECCLLLSCQRRSSSVYLGIVDSNPLWPPLHPPSPYPFWPVWTHFDLFLPVLPVLSADPLKTHFDPFGPVLTQVYLFWPVRTCFDQFWPILTLFDLFWPVLAIVNQFWPVFTGFHQFSPIFTLFHQFSTFFNRFHNLLPILPVFNHFHLFSLVLTRFHWYWWYYLHMSRDSVFPVCGIFYLFFDSSLVLHKLFHFIRLEKLVKHFIQSSCIIALITFISRLAQKIFWWLAALTNWKAWHLLRSFVCWRGTPRWWPSQRSSAWERPLLCSTTRRICSLSILQHPSSWPGPSLWSAFPSPFSFSRCSNHGVKS